MKRLSLVGRVTVLATAVALVVGVMFVAALLAILSLRSAENQEKQSAARTVATLRVENLSVDVGSAVRGYALSRNARFLDLYHTARDRLPKALQGAERGRGGRSGAGAAGGGCTGRDRGVPRRITPSP